MSPARGRRRSERGRAFRAAAGRCRPRAGRFFSAIAASACSLVCAFRASAAEPIHLSYSAFSGCPTSGQFFELVRARTPQAELAQPGRPAARYDVAFTPQGDAVHGSLVVVGPGGGQQTRDMSGETCSDVASALALVVALAVDPAAAPPEAPAAPKAPKGAPAPAKEEPLPASATAPLLVSVHLLSSSVSELAPNMGFGASLEKRFAASGPLMPRVRATFFTVKETFNIAEADYRLPYHDARVIQYALRFEGCPFMLLPHRRVALSPCVGVDAAYVRVDSDVPGALTDEGSYWVAPVGVGRLQWFPVPDQWVLEAQAAAFVPLVEHAVVLNDPKKEVRSSPLAGVFFGIGVGAAF